MDGIPFANGAKRHMWPILAAFDDSPPPITVTTYDSDGKPGELDQFIYPFLNELKTLQENGLRVGNKNNGFRFIPVETVCWICDAPARAWLKNIKGHSGYYGCERCDMKGVRFRNAICHNRAMYAKANPREDVAFDEMKYWQKDSEKRHQHGATVLMN